MDKNISMAPRAQSRLSFDLLATWAVTIAAVLAAVVLIPSTTIPFLNTKVTILAIGGLIALASYILARLTRGNIIVPPMMLVGMLWLLPLAYALSMLFSGTNISSAFFGTQFETDTLGFMLLLAGSATIVALLFRRVQQYRIFLSVASLGMALILVAQVIFVFLGQVMPSKVSATSNLVGSFVDLGMVVGLGVILALLALRFLTITGWKKTVMWVGIVIGLCLLALVNSPVVWTLVGLSSLGLFIEAILRRRVAVDEADLEGVSTIEAVDAPEETASGDIQAIATPLIILVVSLFFIIGGAKLGTQLTTDLHTNVLDVRPSWQSTFAIGSHTYSSSPIFGSGPNTFGQQWLRFRDRSLNTTPFWNLNFSSGIGYIPTSFVTEGLLGALAWLVFLGFFIYLGLRALLFRTPTDPFVRYVSIASFVSALYVFVIGIFAVPGPVVLMIGFLFAGLFISSLRYAGTRQEWGILFAKNPKIGFMIVFVLTLLLLGSVGSAYVVINRYIAENDFDKASVALSNGNLSGADTAIAQSILLAPTDQAYQLQALIGVAHMNHIAGDSSLTPTQAQQQFQAALTQSIQAAQNATKLGPGNYQNWAVLGSVYETVVPLKIDGAYQNAKDAYTHAIALSPTDPTLEYTLAQLEIQQGNSAAAETDLDQAISLKPDYTQAIFLLSQLQVQEGKAKDALQAAEAALYFAPNDPTVLFQVGLLRSANGDPAGAIQALSQAVQLNPQYANAHFFLGVLYAQQNQFPQALTQLQAVAGLSSANATAVAADIAALKANKNPFPASQAGAIGVPQPGATTAATTNNKVVPASATQAAPAH